MGGGKYDYAGAYSKYKPGDASDADFEAYVDSQGDLKNAWQKIQDEPQGEQGSYWIPRGATSKAAFGRAHAAEDQALSTGSYHGGTDVDPYTGGTRFENYLTNKSRSDTTTDTTTDENTAPPFYKTGGGSYGDRNYPIGLMDYDELEPLAASYGLEDSFSPWAQPDYIPDSLWNYTPPELVDWDMSDSVPWDWATKDISEYTPVDEVTKARVAQQMREGRQEGYQNPYPGLVDPNWGTDASNPYASPDYNAAANAAIAAQIAAANAAGAYPSMDMSAGVVDTTGLGFDIGEIDTTEYM